MIVDCSDSRVNEGAIFDADPGTIMFEGGDVSSNAVLTYAVGTLKVKHIVIDMAPLPDGYAERWLGHTTLPALPSSSPSSTTSTSGSTPSAPEETPTDLAVQRWILPIRKIYEASGRPEIREHREGVQRLLSSPSWTRERIARVLMGAERAVGSEYRKGEESGMGENGRGEKGGVGEVKLHDGAFRALVEENVKANHHEAYTKALSTDAPLHPVYVHGWVYDLETGVVSDLGVSAGPPGWVPPPGGVQGFPMRGA
ncbi:hypothetical protein DFP72DRAFT_905688 [Ephemerocybe angulata]|uniref:Carbonic anhydrase n=1 Tax=Ephemerocybe angulata TaxID=980116 RepID=A0A8H6HT67_9AGAR|nr:hypothetical protein DFP72DRAFT_905688 [Tulosesus angulatus]